MPIIIAKNEPVSIEIGYCYGVCGPVNLTIPLYFLPLKLRRSLFSILKQLKWFGNSTIEPTQCLIYDTPKFEFSFLRKHFKFDPSCQTQESPWSLLADWIRKAMKWAYGSNYTNIIPHGSSKLSSAIELGAPNSLGKYQITI